MPQRPRIEALAVALSGAYLRRAIGVAVVVGSVLNAINQGDALLAGGPINLPKATLTFVVPFCVATFGAWSALIQTRHTPPPAGD